MVFSLDNFAMATIKKNEMVEQLVKINAKQADSIMSITKSLANEKSLNDNLLYILSLNPSLGQMMQCNKWWVTEE